LPDKGKDRKTYYYSGTSGWINGKPRVVNLRYLGTLESIIQISQNPPISEPLEVDSLRFGAVVALWAQAKELDMISVGTFWGYQSSDFSKE
jgi:hypothetical protein